jgi:hypothetical protein
VGASLPERIRSTAFAMLGFVAAAGLGLVLLFSQPIAPLLSLGPLPSPPASHGAVHHGMGLPARLGEDAAGTTAAAAPALSTALDVALPAEALEGGSAGTALAQPTLAVGHVAGAGAGQLGGGEGSPHASPGPVVTPAQPPQDGPESIPASTPVSGSSSSSGLFVRSSVVIGKGEIGTLSEGSPVSEPEPEPEAPVEPEVPVEVPVEPVPAPEVPAEPAPEPEGPATPIAESEAGAEAPVAAEESTPDP